MMLAALALVAASALAQEPTTPVKEAIQRAEAKIAAIIAVPDKDRTFENTLGALDDLYADLDHDTGIPIFMENVAVDPAVRAAARADDEYVSNWQTQVSKRQDLYRAIKAYADLNPLLEGERARLLKFTLRDYRRAGLGLPDDVRAKVLENEEKQNKLGIDFGQGVADDETRVAFAKNELIGVPEDALAKQVYSNGLYLFAMDDPSYDAIASNCKIEATRHKAWVAYKRRGGEKNIHVLEDLLKLRYDDAKMLGYANYVEFVAETRMAKNAATIQKFFDELRPVVRKKALVDYQEFLEEKRRDTHNPKAQFYPWDYGYYKNQLAKRKYAVDKDLVREYFPMESVVKGLFATTQSLYGVKFNDVTAKATDLGLPTWHPDVKLYEVIDEKTGATLGHFFTDLYPRKGKYTHAACWNLQGHKVYMDGHIHLPLAAMVTNFTKPGSGKPSLLSHDEVTTFFHEFGHCLHNMFSQATTETFSGTSVERDFVEAPSQMFENWTWDPVVLSSFARHYKTGKPLPKALLDGMLKARYLGSGMEAEHQFYYSLSDLAYHLAPDGKVDTTAVALDLYPKIELYPKVGGIFYQASFTHFVGYGAAYYSYMWSLVYAQDMFQRFKELGILDPKAGAYYREKILSRGGTMDAADMVRDYLGREPKMDSFLEHLGLKN